MTRNLCLLLCAALLLCASGMQIAIPGVKTTYKVVTEGAGDKVVAKNSKVKVHATGTVIETDKKFWSTKDKGQQPFEYTAGVGGVIKGWDQGCLGMKLGEVRQLTIPADEGCRSSEPAVHAWSS